MCEIPCFFWVLLVLLICHQDLLVHKNFFELFTVSLHKKICDEPVKEPTKSVSHRKQKAGKVQEVFAVWSLKSKKLVDGEYLRSAKT